MKIGFNQSDIDFSEFKGQTVQDVIPIGRDLANIKFSGGNLNIECSWRLRNTRSILVGYSERKNDTTSNNLKNHLLTRAIINIYHYEKI